MAKKKNDEKLLTDSELEKVPEETQGVPVLTDEEIEKMEEGDMDQYLVQAKEIADGTRKPTHVSEIFHNIKTDIADKTDTFMKSVVSNVETVTGVVADAIRANEDSKEEGFVPFAYVDGSYNVNTNVYGYGVVYQFTEDGKVGFVGGSDNNEAYAKMHNVAGEICGAMKVVELAQKAKIKRLRIYYDYTGIEYWVTEKWAARNPVTQKYRSFMQNSGIRLDFKKVKAHTGVEYNEKADQIAKENAGITV